MARLQNFKANKSLNVTAFIHGFCETLEEAGFALHWKVANANFKQFRVTQSRSRQELIKIAFFPIVGKEFELKINLKDLGANPEEYLENTMFMTNQAIQELKKGDVEVIH